MEDRAGHVSTKPDDGMHRDIHWWIQGFAGDGDIDGSAQGTIDSVDYRNKEIAVN